MPPTPGPVGAAGILGADLGLVILLGIPVSLVGLLAGWLFATKIASKVTIEPSSVKAEPAEEVDIRNRPSLLKSLLPIFVPILFIVLRSLEELPSAPFGKGNLSMIFGFIGQPSVALLIGAGLSFLLPIQLKKEMLSTTGWLGQGIMAAAGIIIITGSGGAFGKVHKGLRNKAGRICGLRRCEKGRRLRDLLHRRHHRPAEGRAFNARRDDARSV